MANTTFTPKKIIGLILILFVPGILCWYGMKGDHNTVKLPVIGPKQVNTNGDTIYHKVAPFSFTNYDGSIVTNETLKDRIYIANFIFTRCPSICPKMSYNMKNLQSRFSAYNDVAFLSHTVDPEYDTQEVLSEYASKIKAKKDKWYMVTGNKHDIYKLARESYFAAADSGNEGMPEDFVHSEMFALIDTQGRIRAFCDGTKEKTLEKHTNNKGVHDFIDDIKNLLKELNEEKKAQKVDE